MKYARVLFFQLLAVAGFAATEAPPSKLSLADAKKYAVEHNFEVTALRRLVDETAATHQRRNAAFFPRLGVAGGVDTAAGTHTSRMVGVGYLYGSYNLFRGFADTYQSEIAETQAEKAKVKLAKTEFRVGLEVERYFHLYLFKKSLMEFKRRAIENNENHKRMAAQRQSAGLASESDVMEFDLRDALLKSDVASLEQELQEARINLIRLLGEEVGASIEPVGVLQHQHLKGTLMDYVNRVKAESEAVQIASRDLAQANTETKLWRSKWLPEINLEARVGSLNILDQPFPNDSTAAMGLVLAKFELFSGNDSYWERRESEARRLRSEASLKQAILTTVSQIEIAFRKIKAIEERVHLEESNFARAKKYYASVLSEYRRGVRNSADVKLAAEVLLEASIRRENFKYEVLTQKLELETTLGGSVQTETVADHDDR